MWAVIGGSGFENFEDFQVLQKLDRKTPFGECSSGFKKIKITNQEMLFLSRHGEHHELLPSEINYRANIFALKAAGASKVISISAVGSLRHELKPGDLVVPRQYIDRTKSIRHHSFCGEGVVGHVSLAEPISLELMQELKNMQTTLSFTTHFEKTYVCIEGPYFSSRAESNTYRMMGADIIGMTNFPEYALAREAGICYLPCAFVTDYDCFDENIAHVTIAEVMDVMKQNKHKAFEILKHLIPKTTHMLPQGCPELGLKAGLMCDMTSLKLCQREWLSTLLSEASKQTLEQVPVMA